LRGARLAGNEQRSTKLILDALNILQQVDKREFCSFICSIDTSAHERLLAEGYVIREPVVICAEVGIGQAFNWYFERYPTGIELADIYFDRGEQFISDFRRRWLEERTPPNRIATKLCWDFDRPGD